MSIATEAAAIAHRAAGFAGVTTGTLTRPHTVKRVDSEELVDGAELAVQATAVITATALILHVLDSTEKRARGRIPAGTVLTIAAAEYAVQADADFGAVTANRVTVTVSPGLAAEATAGDPVALGDGATWTGVRYLRMDQQFAETFQGFGDRDAGLSIPTDGLVEAPALGDIFTGASSEFVGRVISRRQRLGRWWVVIR